MIFCQCSRLVDYAVDQVTLALQKSLVRTVKYMSIIQQMWSSTIPLLSYGCSGGALFQQSAVAGQVLNP